MLQITLTRGIDILSMKQGHQHEDRNHEVHSSVH